MTPARPGLLALAAGTLLLASPAGPYDIALFPTSRAPGAEAQARLVPGGSPFGIGVTQDGRASYDVRITAKRLPRPESLGPFTAYLAWATTTDLTKWVRLGVVRSGISTVGPVELNKFLLVVTAEADTAVIKHSGPTVLHGTSPSGWLQSFLTHPLFRGIAQ
jgi:hypothetical protein